MGIHAKVSNLARAKIVLVALTVCFSCAICILPAAATGDHVDNHLCLDAGFGFYGVTDHVHLTDTSGTYHISTFGQASAWTYYGTGDYCDQNSANLGCTTTVYEDIFKDGSYLATSPGSSNSGVHSVSTGDHSYGTSFGHYIAEAFVTADFGSNCTSEAFGALSTTTVN